MKGKPPFPLFLLQRVCFTLPTEDRSCLGSPHPLAKKEKGKLVSAQLRAARWFLPRSLSTLGPKKALHPPSLYASTPGLRSIAGLLGSRSHPCWGFLLLLVVLL